MNWKLMVRFLAIMLIALAVVPTGAHFFELPKKMALSQENYFVVQGIYRGWALFGIVIFAAIVVSLVSAFTFPRRTKAFGFALTGFILMVAGLAIFFMWTLPANQATENWTIVPTNWEQLRVQWEYSHAAAAIADFLALGAATCAVLFDRC